MIAFVLLSSATLTGDVDFWCHQVRVKNLCMVVEFDRLATQIDAGSYRMLGVPSIGGVAWIPLTSPNASAGPRYR